MMDRWWCPVTVLDARTELLASQALVPVSPVVDLGRGRGPAWLDGWMGTHNRELIGWRRALHARPELARQERLSTALVASRLAEAGLQPRILPGDAGLICDV